MTYFLHNAETTHNFFIYGLIYGPFLLLLSLKMFENFAIPQFYLRFNITYNKPLRYLLRLSKLCF